MSGPSIDRANSRQDWATPPELIAACEKRFGAIAFDLAAEPHNTKAERFYTESDNSLVQPWHKLGGVLWLNPPFSNIAPWAKKCAEESQMGAKILFLVPASVGAKWFRDHVFYKSLVYLLGDRITFVGAEYAYPKDCIIAAFGFGNTGFQTWSWR